MYPLIIFQVTPIPGKADTLLAQTTDFFYPLVDDPYMQVIKGTLLNRHIFLDCAAEENEKFVFTVSFAQ